MTANPTPYANWKAPAEDGQMLIWPKPDEIVRATAENTALLNGACGVRLQGMLLSDLRRAAKAFIGCANEVPLVSTGHQVELYHPGVWVKDALVHAIAKRIGGRAYHFAVDTDAPKHLHLRWPTGSEAITDDARLASAASCEALSNPTPRHLRDIERRFGEAAGGWDFTPSTEPFFDAMRHGTMQGSMQDDGLAKTLAAATHKVDWGLGLRYDQLLVSPLWVSRPYLVFVHHLLSRAPEFAAVYNKSLADYRRQHGIRTSARPMPDLVSRGASVEMPFWLDTPHTAGRARLALVNDVGHCSLDLPGGERFTFDPRGEGWEAAGRLQAFCRRNEVVISPRAMTLTMFFRLVLSDVFVHGIGGGRYDQVTDAVIRSHFGLEPPRFAVTTATLHFPAAVGLRRVNLLPLLQEGRRIRHGLLSAEKRSMVAAIEALPRKSAARSALFYRMHARLASESTGASRLWEQRLRDARHEYAAQDSLFDRELFFAIQPEARLRDMIDRYNRAF